MKFLKMLLLLGFLTVSTSNFAQNEANETLISGIDLDWLTFNRNLPVDVIAANQVEDDCWTNAKQTENAVKLELQRSGFEIYDSESENSSLTNQVVLKAVGFKAEGVCAISHKTTLKVIETDKRSYEDGKYNLSSIYWKILWNDGGILTGDNSSERLKNSFVETIQELLLLRVQVKKDIFDEAIEASEEEGARQYWQLFNETM